MTIIHCQKWKKYTKTEKTKAISPQNDNEILLFSIQSPHLQKKLDMESDVLELFVSLLEQEKVYMNPDVSFCMICGWIKTSPEEMDSILLREFGYSGDDILKVYRDGIALHFMEKYGIKL